MFFALRKRIRTSSVRRCAIWGVEIIAERVPARQDRAALDPRFQHPQRRRLGDLEGTNSGIVDALAPQGVGARSEQRPDAAEVVEQSLGEGFRVDAGDGQREQIFDELIIVEAARPGGEQPLAKPRAVSS